ncbi:MAG: NAD(P)H-hydrate dehydratase [Bacteroidota bacterium]
MNNIFTAAQTRQLDQYTIQHEPIASIDLMERASKAFVWEFGALFFYTNQKVVVLCGVGNNGGDGFAIARLLQAKGDQVQIIHALVSETCSPDCAANIERLPDTIPVHQLRKGDDFPAIDEHDVLIDAFFGSGLNRPVVGYWGELIQHVNQSNMTKVAVDVPSGLFADQASSGNIIEADHTISFQFPKLAFFAAENEPYFGQWHIADIGLSEKAMSEMESPYAYFGDDDILPLLQTRGTFDHKGTFGHALVVGGSYGKMGAIVLAAKAALRTGAGLVSVHIPKCGYDILQISLPEAMVFTDSNDYLVSKIGETKTFKAIGIGPGLGTDPLSVQALANLLQHTELPMVIDADALNIIAKHPELFDLIPPKSILTPHPKEFERLFGATNSSFERWQLQIQKSTALDIYIVLKGGHSSISTPEGALFFSTAGNPGMGTAGSGDVLTGMLTGLLAQGYSSKNAALVGVHLHGVAGDLAAQQNSMPSLIASDLIAQIGAAYQYLPEQQSYFYPQIIDES